MSNEIFKKKTVNYVCSGDLEKFIKEETGKIIDLPFWEKACHDLVTHYHVDVLDKKYELAWSGFKEGNVGCGLSLVLNGLCSDGKIDAGEYLVEFIWPRAWSDE